jgi:2-iminobutanoate/2-iminopropanoate deaminase
MVRQIAPSDFTPTMGAYSHGIVLPIGEVELVFVTGQIALGADGALVSEDVADQTEYVFQNIGKILTAAGADFSHVVKAQIFLTNIADFRVVSPIRDKYFGRAKPVSTLVEVSSLVAQGCKVEIEIIAAKPRD